MFNVGNREHFTYYRQKLPWYMNKWILRRDVPHMEPLVQVHDERASSGSDKADVEGKHYEA